MELCRNLPNNNGGWLGRGFTGVYQGGAAVEKQSVWFIAPLLGEPNLRLVSLVRAQDWWHACSGA